MTTRLEREAEAFARGGTDAVNEARGCDAGPPPYCDRCGVAHFDECLSETMEDLVEDLCEYATNCGEHYADHIVDLGDNPTRRCRYEELRDKVRRTIANKIEGERLCGHSRKKVIDAGYEAFDYQVSTAHGFDPEAMVHNDAGVRFVNVYRVDRCYGGPEEGGWYYDAGEIVETHIVVGEQAARLLSNALIAGRFSNEGSRGLGSVLSAGEWRICVEDCPGENFPKEAQRYE